MGEMDALKKKHSAAQAARDKHQQAVARYQEDLKAFNSADTEATKDDGGIPIEQKEKSCQAAGLIVVSELIQKLIMEKGADVALEVNRGDKDPQELKDITVQEEYKEEEIITDPVLMALRKFDEEHTNKIATKPFRELFDAMAEDELQVGTHIFYGDIPDEDLAVAKATVQDMGLETDDGDITYPDFKGFIESKDVEVASGRPPSNLVTSLMTNRMDGWLEDNEVTKLYSPRSWRMKLQAEEDEPKTARKGKKKKSSSDGDDEEEDDEGAASPRGT